jgi:hypothetical protein
MNFRETYELLTPLLQRYDLGADFLLGADDRDAFVGDDTNSDT